MKRLSPLPPLSLPADGRKSRCFPGLCLLGLAWIFIFALAIGRPSPAAETVPDIFDPAAARSPAPGDWLEYRIAFPVDPLENRLSKNPVPPLPSLRSLPETPADGDGTFAFLPDPSFDPPAAWLTLPLRITIMEVGGDGVRATLAFADSSQEILLAARPEEERADFRYEKPQPPVRRDNTRVNGGTLAVEIVQRIAEGYGFIRWFSAEVPFGIVRFATENVDLVLMAWGNGPAPEFPLQVIDAIDPPPGLYALTVGME